MNKPKFIFSSVVFALVFSLNLSIFAQENKQTAEPNYEIVLQTLVASENSAAKNEVPANLSNVVKKLKQDFSFNDYQLTSTYLERVENKGSFEYKGVTNEFVGKDTFSPSFNEWALRGMKRNSEAIGFEYFKFGTRLPLISESKKDETGKTSPAVAYEFVGFTINNFSLIENKPTVLGTLNLPNKSQMAFVVMTVRQVE